MKSADTVPLNEECIEDIASNLGEDILKHFLSCVLPEYKIMPTTSTWWMVDACVS